MKKELEFFRRVKEECLTTRVDFRDPLTQGSYRKFRMHLDRLILRLEGKLK